MSTKKISVGVLSILLCGTAAFAQSKAPVETRNAALRYWLAFADLQDPPGDTTTTELLEKTAAGEAAWDEAKLGPILDKNEEAIRRMQRATKLPECDWGLEYELGPRASIAYVPRARVLARLNTLYGMRLAAKGYTQQAVETWLAGIRFSQHLAQGGTLIFSLIAKMSLLSNFTALTQAAQRGQLTQAQRTEAEKAIRMLPESGFDWSAAWEFEQACIETGLKEIQKSADPAKAYQDITGEPLASASGLVVRRDGTIPSGLFVLLPFAATDFQAFEDYMSQVSAALKSNSELAKSRIEALETERRALAPLLQKFIPSASRANEARREIAGAREKVLQALDAQ
jgi:hypothetical protein